MNKKEFLHELNVKTKYRYPQSILEDILNKALDLIETQVSYGNEVKLVGFGTFMKVKRKARAGRNPQTGMAMQIPATSTAKFRPGRAFKALINE